MIFMLTFVRHGITEYNAQGLYQGQVDVPLNDLGFRQAELLGSYLENIKFDKIYSSDLSRCKQTVDVVVKKNKCSPPEVVLDKRLREQSYGIFEGKSFEDCWRSGDGRIPGGETDEQVIARTDSFLKQLCKDMTAIESCQKEGAKEGTSPEALPHEEDTHKLGKDKSETGPEAKDGHIRSFKELGYPEEFCYPHVLLSSHGMLLRLLIRLLKMKYKLKIRKGLSMRYKSPNTGLTGFMVEIADGKLVNVECEFLFCDDHLDGLEEDDD